MYNEKDKRSGSCRVTNGSGRPVRRVRCRLILDDRIIPAGKFGLGTTFSGPVPIGSEQSFLPPKPGDINNTTGEYLNLLAGQTILAEFTIPEEVQSYETAKYIIQFTDDAERRWELDGNMHLAPAPDEE